MTDDERLAAIRARADAYREVCEWNDHVLHTHRQMRATAEDVPWLLDRLAEVTEEVEALGEARNDLAAELLQERQHAAEVTAERDRLNAMLDTNMTGPNGTLIPLRTLAYDATTDTHSTSLRAAVRRDVHPTHLVGWDVGIHAALPSPHG